MIQRKFSSLGALNDAIEHAEELNLRWAAYVVRERMDGETVPTKFWSAVYVLELHEDDVGATAA